MSEFTDLQAKHLGLQQEYIELLMEHKSILTDKLPSLSPETIEVIRKSFTALLNVWGSYRDESDEAIKQAQAEFNKVYGGGDENKI